MGVLPRCFLPQGVSGEINPLINAFVTKRVCFDELYIKYGKFPIYLQYLAALIHEIEKIIHYDIFHKIIKKLWNFQKHEPGEVSLKKMTFREFTKVYAYKQRAPLHNSCSSSENSWIKAMGLFAPHVRFAPCYLSLGTSNLWISGSQVAWLV